MDAPQSLPEAAPPDPFALLGLPRRFALDPKEADTALLRASARWHPDRFALAPEAERLAAEDRMAALNEAHRVIADPWSRAEALLRLEGLPLETGTDLRSSPEFLMEMMELKEEAEEARRVGSAAVLDRLRRQLLEEERRRLQAFGEAWDALPQKPGERRQGLQELRALLNRVTYLRRTRQEIEEALLPGGPHHAAPPPHE